jgi:hypothetical protein
VVICVNLWLTDFSRIIADKAKSWLRFPRSYAMALIPELSFITMKIMKGSKILLYWLHEVLFPSLSSSSQFSLRCLTAKPDTDFRVSLESVYSADNKVVEIPTKPPAKICFSNNH